MAITCYKKYRFINTLTNTCYNYGHFVNTSYDSCYQNKQILNTINNQSDHQEYAA